MSFIKVHALGNLTRDPEVRYLAKGTALCEFSIAASRKYKTSEGVEKEEVCFLEVVAWGRRGEVIKEYFSKGQPIFVEGHLTLDQWDDKETGKKRSKHKLSMENFEFVGSKKDGAGGGGQSAASTGAATVPAQTQGERPPPIPDDDDIPF